MPSLVTFSDFLLATNEHVVTAPDQILNDAQLNTYFIAECLRGRDASEIVKGGSKITERIQLTTNGSYRSYTPNETFNPTAVQTLTKIEAPWTFSKADFSFTDEEILLNDGSDRDVFKELKKSYTQAAITDMWNGMEAALWAVPDASLMEAAAGAAGSTGQPGEPLSIVAMVTGDQTNFHAPGFTNVQTVDPAGEDGWRNQFSDYAQGALDDEADGIFAAFDDMWLSVGFESPESASEYFENDRLRKMKIVTDKNGRRVYSRLLRAANDRLRMAQDPGYNDPTYEGIPVKWASSLDGQAVWNDPDNNGTLIASTLALPRYLWLNLQYLYPIFHARRYMTMIGPIPGGPTQPFSHVTYYNTYWQLFMRSRKRQGYVGPAAA